MHIWISSKQIAVRVMAPFNRSILHIRACLVFLKVACERRQLSIMFSTD